MSRRVLPIFVVMPILFSLLPPHARKTCPPSPGFVNHAKSKNWQALREFKEFNPTANNLIAFVIRCSLAGTLVLVRSPFETFDSDEVLMIDAIPTGSFAQIAAIVPPSGNGIHIGSPVSPVPEA